MSVVELAKLAGDRVRLHQYPHERDWVKAAAGAIAGGLTQFLQHNGSARLLLSGGGTPAPVYAELAYQSLDWNGIEVGLVDERFLPEGDGNRNDGLIRRTLLREMPIANAAAQAVFIPLIAANDTLESAVDAANKHAQPATVVVLGMGDDGHIASLFPGMAGLDAALAAETPYVAVDATGCPGSQTWPLRISLTPAGLASAATRILLIRGEGKRTLLELVVSGSDEHEYPVRLAWKTPGPVLDVYWCP